MSFRHQELSVQIPGLTSSEAFVLRCLADHARNDGTYSFPGVALLSRETRLEERTVRYTILALIEMGVIEEVRIPGTRRKAYNMTFDRAIAEGLPEERKRDKWGRTIREKKSTREMPPPGQQREEDIMPPASPARTVALTPQPLQDRQEPPEQEEPYLEHPLRYASRDEHLTALRRQKINTDAAIVRRMLDNLYGVPSV